MSAHTEQDLCPPERDWTPEDDRKLADDIIFLLGQPEPVFNRFMEAVKKQEQKRRKREKQQLHEALFGI